MSFNSTESIISVFPYAEFFSRYMYISLFSLTLKFHFSSVPWFSIPSTLSIIEILETKVIGYNKIGIYRLFSHKSPSNTYILLKKNSAIQFIDLKDFEKSFKSILKFLNSTKFDDEKKIFYLEKIIEVYHNNNYSEKIKL